jgi:two-component system, OmpR family, sensor histidine kinase ArlS
MKNNFIKRITNTLKGRLTLWYIISVGLIVFLSLVSVGGLFLVTLQDQIDHHVYIAVNEAKQVVENYRGEERDNLIKNLVSAKGMTVVVLSPDGSAILETNSPDIAVVTEHQLQKILGTSNLYDEIPTHFTENNIRFAALPATVSAGKGIVAVGYSTQVLYGTLYKLVAVVLGVIFFLVLPVAFLGYKYLNKQLYQLENIAVQAKAITDTSSLAKRININSSAYELKTIQTAINSMLLKLEHIFINEREFFSDAAHTLKTPLAVLRSQMENANLTERVKIGIFNTIDKANDTISDLLFLSKIAGSAQKLEKTSLSKMMVDLAELANTLGEDKKLKVTTSIQKGVVIKADKKLLQRALSNIAYNAVAYNKPQGSVHLSLKQRVRSATLTIKDNGAGISKNDLPKIFTRFFRGTNTNEKGSGLGLAISKAVVENLGGQIKVDSKINDGTTITISFT